MVLTMVLMMGWEYAEMIYVEVAREDGTTKRVVLSSIHGQDDQGKHPLNVVGALGWEVIHVERTRNVEADLYKVVAGSELFAGIRFVINLSERYLLKRQLV